MMKTANWFWLTSCGVIAAFAVLALLAFIVSPKSEYNIKQALVSNGVNICNEKKILPFSMFDQYVSSRLFPWYYTSVTAISVDETDEDKLDVCASLIAQMKEIEYVKISDSALSNESIELLVSNDSIRKLHLPGCNIDNRDIAYISEMHNLTVLDLTGTEITAECLSGIEKMANLHELHIGGTEISVKDVHDSQIYDKLKYLSTVIVSDSDGTAYIGMSENVEQDKKDSNEPAESEE